jgi:hypothetical protein
MHVFFGIQPDCTIGNRVFFGGQNNFWRFILGYWNFLHKPPKIDGLPKIKLFLAVVLDWAAENYPYFWRLCQIRQLKVVGPPEIGKFSYSHARLAQRSLTPHFLSAHAPALATTTHACHRSAAPTTARCRLAAPTTARLCLAAACNHRRLE